jgi:hypothetical protein
LTGPMLAHHLSFQDGIISIITLSQYCDFSRHTICAVKLRLNLYVIIHRCGRGAQYEHDRSRRSTSFDTRKPQLTLPIPKSKSSKFVEFFSAVFGSQNFNCKECTTTEIFNLLVEKFNHFLYNGTGSGCRLTTWFLFEEGG